MGKNKKKEPFNIFAFMNKHRKTVVGGISIIIVLTLVLGLFAQFAYM